MKEDQTSNIKHECMYTHQTISSAARVARLPSFPLLQYTRPTPPSYNRLTPVLHPSYTRPCSMLSSDTDQPSRVRRRRIRRGLHGTLTTATSPVGTRDTRFMGHRVALHSSTGQRRGRNAFTGDGNGISYNIYTAYIKIIIYSL